MNRNCIRDDEGRRDAIRPMNIPARFLTLLLELLDVTDRTQDATSQMNGFVQIDFVDGFESPSVSRFGKGADSEFVFPVACLYSFRVSA